MCKQPWKRFSCKHRVASGPIEICDTAQADTAARRTHGFSIDIEDAPDRLCPSCSGLPQNFYDEATVACAALAAQAPEGVNRIGTNQNPDNHPPAYHEAAPNGDPRYARPLYVGSRPSPGEYWTQDEAITTTGLPPGAIPVDPQSAGAPWYPNSITYVMPYRWDSPNPSYWCITAYPGPDGQMIHIGSNGAYFWPYNTIPFR